ncbi:hypothetical protein [Lyngbya confervoides]|nr:hypothetical protein [Lyngbya confervoides]
MALDQGVGLIAILVPAAAIAGESLTLKLHSRGLDYGSQILSGLC